MNAFDHVRAIVAQHQHRQSLPNPYRDELDGLIWPGIVLAPSGREVLFDRKILDAVFDLAQFLKTDNQPIGNDEWLDLLRKSVAYALDAIDPSADLDTTALQVLNAIRSSLEFSKAGLGQLEFPFGCTLFEGVALPAYHIGPVSFETRQDWIERKFSEGSISRSTRRRALHAWEGKTNYKRRHSVDSELEKAVIGLGKDADFICSVRTDGISSDFGRRRAKTAARLALTATALMWEKTSRALDRMNLVEDRIVRTLDEITFHGSRIFSCGSRKSHPPGGQKITLDEWERLHSEFSGHFAVIGDTLGSIVDSNNLPRRPKVTHALAHALLWFHQGCREDEQVIAVVKFAAALDCLALGGSRKGIANLVRARLGIESNKALWVRGNQTAEEAIEEIYDYARNATMHGRKGDGKGRPDSKPFNDWKPTRERAESLARYCLLSCIDWAATHPDIDEPESWRTL